MRYFRLRILAFCAFLCLFSTALKGLTPTVSHKMLYREYPDKMRYATRFSETGSDSAFVPAYKEWRRFDSDSLYVLIANQGCEAVRLELYYYQTGIMPYLSDTQKLQEKEKLEAALRRYTDREFQKEGQIMRIGFIEDREEQLLAWERLSKSREWREDIPGQLRITHNVLEHRIVDAQHSQSFRLAHEILQLLDTPLGQLFEDRRELYFTIGDLYYRFRDYERAIPLLEKALTEAPFTPEFWQRANLRAHNTLGVYYQDLGDLERSDQHFMSMLESQDMVKYRPMYDVIAIANLGRNQLKRKAYDQALALYQTALPLSLEEHDNLFSSGIVMSMGEIYLGLGRLTPAKTMIDSASVLISENPVANRNRYRNLYALMSRYYSRMGNVALAEAYMDSTTMANKRYEDEFSAMTLLRAEQEQFDAQTLHKDEILRAQHNRLIFAITIACILLASTLVAFRFYRKKRRAYRSLVLKLRRWADDNTLEKVGIMMEPTKKSRQEALTELSADMGRQDFELTTTIHNIMLQEQLYKNSELSLDMLAQRMELNRETISRAINRSTGKNFAHFLNEYRIKEAVKVMTNTRHHSIGLDIISEMVGFNNRTTFARAFKQHTEMTPSEFRKHK